MTFTVFFLCVLFGQELSLVPIQYIDALVSAALGRMRNYSQVESSGLLRTMKGAEVGVVCMQIFPFRRRLSKYNGKYWPNTKIHKKGCFLPSQ